MVNKILSKKKRLPNKDQVLNPITLKDEPPDEDENEGEDEKEDEENDEEEEDVLDTDLIRIIYKRRR